jgi:hypothetical protein
MPTKKTIPSLEELQTASEPAAVAVEAHVTTSEPAGALTLNNRFASSDYDDPDAKRPRMQALRGEDPKQFGLFLSLETLSECQWLECEISDLIDYGFQSGKTEKGLLIKQPRMLIHQTSPLFAYDRVAVQKVKRLVGMVYDPVMHSDRETYGFGCIYDVVLLDKQNMPLHELPLQILLKGATAASFNNEWKIFLNEIVALHARAFQIPVRGKNAIFNSLCVFCPTLDRQVVGTKVKSPALKIVGHEKPTIDNWTDYFIGCLADEKIEGYTRNFNYAMRYLPSSIALPATADSELVEA